MKQPKASIDTSDVLNLLDDEERAEIAAQLSELSDVNADASSLESLSPAELIRRTTAIRMPFMLLLRDVMSMTETVEGGIQGNIRFVLLPTLVANLKIDVGPQLRSVVATALSTRLLQASQQLLEQRLASLERAVFQPCISYHARQMRRDNSIGKDLLRLVDNVTPLEAHPYRRQAEIFDTRMQTEYNGQRVLAFGLNARRPFLTGTRCTRVLNEPSVPVHLIRQSGPSTSWMN